MTWDNDDIMQPKDPKSSQIFPRSRRILKAHMVHPSWDSRHRLEAESWWPSWCLACLRCSSHVTSCEPHDDLISSVHRHGVLNFLTCLECFDIFSYGHDSRSYRSSVAGKSNPREAMSVASRKSASIKIYWDLPYSSFFILLYPSFDGENDCQPMLSYLLSLWSFVIIGGGKTVELSIYKSNHIIRNPGIQDWVKPLHFGIAGVKPHVQPTNQSWKSSVTSINKWH